MRVTSHVDEQFLRAYREKAQLNLIKTADAIRTDLMQAQTMPMDTGFLQNDSTYVSTIRYRANKVSIISDTPYARRLYFHPEYNFRKDRNPNAGGQWFQPYISGAKKDFAGNTFARLMRRG